VIFDELHAQPNRELWDVMTSGQGARRQPMTVAITTAGNDVASLCYEQYLYGLQLRGGSIEDPTFFFRWWGADFDDDWTDEAVWRKANPNLGVSTSLEFLQSEVRQAKQSPARQNTVRQLYLNQWVRQVVRWLDLHLWDENAGMVVEEELVHRECYGGLDLASTADFCAFVLVFPEETPGEGHHVICRFWLPEGALERRSPMRDTLQAWAADSRILRITPGDVVDYGAVFEDIDALARTYDIRSVGYDRWNASQLVRDLDDNGLLCEGVAQTTSALNAASRELERLLGEHSLHHGGQPVLRWMCDAVTVLSDSEGNIKPSKKKSTEKIDGIVALVMALKQWMADAESSVFAIALNEE